MGTNITDTEAAWAAGFIDGEGSFSIIRFANTFRLRLTIDQNDVSPLEKLKNLFGGAINKRSNRKTSTYTLGTAAILPLLTAIYPYVTVKKADVSIGLQFRSLVGNRGRGKLEDSIYKSMEQLRNNLKQIHEDD